MLAKVRAMMATESLNVAENKATASGAACKYLKCPCLRHHAHVRRHIPFGDAYADVLVGCMKHPWRSESTTSCFGC